MKIINNINDLKAAIRIQKSQGRSIGLVPTMGYLHEGHISLVRESKKHTDFTVMSIFVNPAQFGANEDFDKYPRNLSRDSKMAEEAGVDLIFAPAIKEMYPKGYKTYVNVEDITCILCGKSRPTHFKGVTTIVAKLFNIIEADKAFFGQKDAQQVAIIKKMVADLNMNVEVVTCPIVRESDGLAMSSRNVYLTAGEREAALVLSKSLFEIEKMILNGMRNKQELIDHIYKKIRSEELAQIDYIEIVDADQLSELDILKGRVLVALAVKFGTTRLIDNIIMEV